MPGGVGLGQLQVFVPPGASALPRFAWLTQQGVFQGALQPRPASAPRTPLDFLEDRSLLPFQDRANQPCDIVCPFHASPISIIAASPNLSAVLPLPMSRWLFLLPISSRLNRVVALDAF